MCGLVGMAGATITADELKYMKWALISDTIRGAHSTGVAAVGADTKPYIHKQAIPGWDFVDSQGYKTIEKALSKYKENVAVLGHNRYATMGKITAQTAHPFRHNHVTGVHNGTLYWHEHLAGGRGAKFDVDSEAIIFALGANNADPVDVLEALDGAYALVWYDDRDKTINFARNEERTLFLAFDRGSHTMLWASEKGMLEWLIEHVYKYDNFTVEALPVGEMQSFYLDDKTFTDTRARTKFTPSVATYNRAIGWPIYPARREQQVKKSHSGISLQESSNPNRLLLPAPTASNILTKDKGFVPNGLEVAIFTEFRKHNIAASTGKAYGYLESSKSVLVEAPCDASDYADYMVGLVSVPTTMSFRNNLYCLDCTEIKDIEYIELEDDENVDEIEIQPSGYIQTATGEIALDRFEEAIKYGCDWCTADIKVSEASQCGTYEGTTNVAVLCPDCTHQHATDNLGFNYDIAIH